MPIIYKKDFSGNVVSNNVPTADVSYWVNRGWSTTPPSTFVPATQPAITPAIQPFTGGDTSTIYRITEDGQVTTRTGPRSELEYFVNQGQGWSFTPPQITTAPTTPTTPVGPESQLTGDFRALFDLLNQQLQGLQKRGQVINPNVEITPERIAEFTRIAETEINPYFQNQLKTAREDLLRNTGYSQEQLLQNELELERQYGKGLRTLGERTAEQGFALSGQREEQEKELAGETQQAIEQGRRELAFRTGGAARRFAERYGTAELPTARTLSRPGAFLGREERNLYELSPEIYQGLVGSEEFARRGTVKRRVFEQEEVERARQALGQTRSLTL